jgi:hypothetical protein
MTKYGRSDEEWEQLTAAGLDFLREHARMGRTTTYTALNTELVHRTGLRTFDFGMELDRAAMGHLLALIVEQELPHSDLMISALVQYADGPGAGPGFYTFAQQLGKLPRNASSRAKEDFWIGQVTGLQEFYGSP